MISKLMLKIHSGAVSIEKDKYLTPAHSLKSTRACPEELIFPRTIPQWNGLSPSVVNSQTTEEFRALLI